VPIKGGKEPKHLTTGKQGATHSPALSPDGGKAVWLELDKDGYEADRFGIVIYDLTKDVRFTVSRKWDRSPDAIAVSKVVSLQKHVIDIRISSHMMEQTLSLPLEMRVILKFSRFRFHIRHIPVTKCWKKTQIQ
jgi:hypothetical protein